VEFENLKVNNFEVFYDKNIENVDEKNIPEGIQFVNNLKILYYCLKYHGVDFTSKIIKEYLKKMVW